MLPKNMNYKPENNAIFCRIPLGTVHGVDIQGLLDRILGKVGQKCSVSCCRSNYNSDTVYTPSFQFPKDENRLALWIRSINRADFEPSVTAIVCIKHLEEKFLIREDRLKRDDGTLLVFQRKKIALTDTAYPTIFPQQPAYLSKQLPAKRKSPSKRHQEIVDRDEEKFSQWCENDKISSFEQFAEKYCSVLHPSWFHIAHDDFVLCYRIETDCPKIVVSIKVFKNLSIKVWHLENEIDTASFNWILGVEKKYDRWTKFDGLLNVLVSYQMTDITFDQKLSVIVSLLQNCSEDIEDNAEKQQLGLNFLKEQAQIYPRKKPSFNMDELIDIPWTSLDIDSQKYITKYIFQKTSYKIMLSDLKYIYCEELTEFSLLHRSEEMNSSMEIVPKKISEHLHQTIESFVNGSSIAGAKLLILNKDSNVLILKSESLLAGIPFIWHFKLQAMDSIMNYIYLVRPLVCMVSELKRRNDELVKLIKQKDEEVGNHKTICDQLVLKTQEFSENVFADKMDKSANMVNNFNNAVSSTFQDELFSKVVSAFQNPSVTAMRTEGTELNIVGSNFQNVSVSTITENSNLNEEIVRRQFLQQQKDIKKKPKFKKKRVNL